MKRGVAVEVEAPRDITNVKVYALLLKETSRDDLLKRMSAELFLHGLVNEFYGEEVIQREMSFPTGLPTIPVPVAIPHSERSSVMQSGIVVAKLLQPVYFRRMDNPDEELGVELVFLLAVKKEEEHLSMILEIMRIVQDQDVLRSLLNAQSAQEIENIMKRELSACTTA